MTNLFVKIQLFLMNLRDEERGQDLIEYALFGGLIAIGIMALGAAVYTGIVTALADGVKTCVDFTSGGCDPW